MRPSATLALLLALSAPTPAGAADDLTVLTDSPGEPPPAKRLYAYLEHQAKAAFDARRKAVAALKTPADVDARKADLKVKFKQALGEMPSVKTPLNARVLGRTKRDGYSVERVVYESRPGHHVTALVYLPDGPPPFPGVLVPCGHSANGKAAEPYQRACILLARNGMAVLCDDPIGQGERLQALTPDGKPAVAGSTAEHTLVGLGALLVGRTAAGYRLWDEFRSLDYLASRPDVDPARLGCTGNSGGGTLTAYLMAYDDRVAVAAPSCYITTLERLFATIGPQDAEQVLTGQVALGIEHADFLTMRAPKPTLLSVGTLDFFDIDGAWTTFREAKRLYGTLGHGERVDLFESDEAHGFTKPRREAAARWMRRWLLGKDDAVTEADAAVATDAECRVTSTGQVLTEFPGEKTAFAFNADRADALERARPALRPEALKAAVRAALAMPADAGPMTVDRKVHLEKPGFTVDARAFETEPGVKVPVILFRPKDVTPGKPLVVYVGADRKEMTAPGGPMETHARAGESVALVEPRGTGESAPGGPPRSPAGADEKEAFLSLLLNRPLLGQRVFDVLRALDGLTPSDPPKPFHLIGVGAGGPVALHVAAVDDRVGELTLRRSLVSWSSVVRVPLSRGQLSQVVPGALAVYDFPDLAASFAPRPLSIVEPVDSSGALLEPGILEKAYARCREAYKANDAEGRLNLK